ncbi:hypothetical protein H6F96_15115 [Microcoleus sp. FACHB-53]|nr:hypothetical protein [Microcoleus sp. FACHB-53]MBD2130441.1 hypothetical protein [Microcoleus sp. FACHB-1]
MLIKLFMGVLPLGHGLLIATLGMIDYRQIKRGKKFLIVELISGGLLVLAWLLIIATVRLELPSIVSLVCGFWLAAVATLVLNIVAIIKAIQAFKNQGNWVLSTAGVLLNLLALIIYLIFALWLSWFLLMMGLGGSYR